MINGSCLLNGGWICPNSQGYVSLARPSRWVHLGHGISSGICFCCVKHKNSRRIWNILRTRHFAGKVSVWNDAAAARRVEQIHGPPQESTNQTHMLVFFLSWLMIKMTRLYPERSWWLLSNMHAPFSSTRHIPLHSQNFTVKNCTWKPFCGWFVFITLHFSMFNAAEKVRLRCIP
jgi:hypothetical protein